MATPHVHIPDGTPVLQRIIKGQVTRWPIASGGTVESSGEAWRCAGSAATPGLIMPLLEAYLLDVNRLPWNFVHWVSDCACEALTNAGQHCRPGSDVQVSCIVVGIGSNRRCTIRVFNVVEVGTPLFPASRKIPRPDQQDVHKLRGRGLPIMKSQADVMVLEDLPGYAKEVTLGFDLKHAPAE